MAVQELQILVSMRQMGQMARPARVARMQLVLRRLVRSRAPATRRQMDKMALMALPVREVAEVAPARARISASVRVAASAVWAAVAVSTGERERAEELQLRLFPGIAVSFWTPSSWLLATEALGVRGAMADPGESAKEARWEGTVPRESDPVEAVVGGVAVATAVLAPEAPEDHRTRWSPMARSRRKSVCQCRSSGTAERKARAAQLLP